MQKHLKLFFILFLLISIAFSNNIDFEKMKGWTPIDSVASYDDSNLWEYINGAADQFYSYGFQELYSCEMKSESLEGVIDVYNMGSCLNAFGIYKTERGDIPEKLKIGAESVITSPMQALLFKDIYYVKVSIYEGKLDQNNGKELLNEINQILPGNSDFPQELRILPATGKIADSENFVKESYLGTSELKTVVFADYSEKPDSKFQYFTLIPEAGETSENIWQKLSEKWIKLDDEDYNILFKKIPYKGIIGIRKTDKGIFGVTDSKSENELIERLGKIVIE